MDKCADEQKFLLNLIETYHSLPALWNVKCEAYSNREEKKKQYDILLGVYIEQYPTATVEDVKKKLNVLRTNFRRERARLARLAKSGAGVDDSSDSQLFYYKQLEFINDVEIPCTSKSTTVSKVQKVLSIL